MIKRVAADGAEGARRRHRRRDRDGNGGATPATAPGPGHRRAAPRPRRDRQGHDLRRRHHRDRAGRRPAGGQGRGRGRQQDHRQAVQVRRRARQLRGLGLRLLGRRLLRAPRRGPARQAARLQRPGPLGQGRQGHVDHGLRQAATPTSSSAARASTPRRAARATKRPALAQQGALGRAATSRATPRASRATAPDGGLNGRP